LKIDTIKRPSKKPFGLVTVGWRNLSIETLDGTEVAQGARPCYDLLEKYAGHVLYIRSRLTDLLQTTGADVWQADIWRGRATRMYLDGTKASVISLRGVLDGDPDPFGSLYEALGFLALHRVGPGSIGTMGWNLWRSTLPRSIELSSPRSIASPAVFGGRQECKEPRTYQHMKSVDMSAAYPHSMAARPFALSLRQVAPSTALDPTVPGLALATVGVADDMPYFPLPARLAPDMIRFQSGTFSGTWTWEELAAAQSLGVHVKVKQCWAPSRTANLFGDWWRIIEVFRTLSPYAARIGKQIANSLWGTFGMRGDDTGVVRWLDKIGDRSVNVPQIAKAMPHHQTCHIAAEASARVRTRLLREGLYGSKFSPVHVDTDGIIIRQSAQFPVGEGAGEWRVKDTYEEIDIRAPQVYRGRACKSSCLDRHPHWKYVTSGVPQSMAEGVFNRVARISILLGTGERDLVLPPGTANDMPRIDLLMKMAESAQTSLYGAPLGGGS
jgi:hypothetical protein